jgi:hypothetical protein
VLRADTLLESGVGDAMKRALPALVLVVVTFGCGQSPTPPVPLSSPTAPAGGAPPSTPAAPLKLQGPITFSGLAKGTAVSGYEESGVRLDVVAGAWEVSDTYGNPRPFIQFTAAGGTTGTGTVQFSAGGQAFTFRSVDVYASTTPIPYVIVGLRNGTQVLSLSGTVPNTFGQFRPVAAGAAVTIDTLKITLTNAAAACCRNPMGIDNVLLTN